MIIHNFKILCIMAINYSLVKLASKFGDKAGVPKFYARAQMNESISLKKFAKLISMQTTVSYADVTAVLVSMQENMIIELQRGNQIDFGELGKFRLQLTSEGAATAAEFKSDINIKGVNIQFIPGSDLANIFVGMEFEQVASRAVQKAALKARRRVPRPSTSRRLRKSLPRTMLLQAAIPRVATLQASRPAEQAALATPQASRPAELAALATVTQETD